MRYFSYKATCLLFVSSLLLFSCVENQTIGKNLLGKDQLKVRSSSTQSFSITQTFKDKVHWGSISSAYIGTLNDLELGQTHAASAFQFRLPQKLYLYSPEVDSVFLSLNYESTYGNPDIEQKARVYKLEGDLTEKKILESNFDITSLLGEEVGFSSFKEKNISDSIFWKSKLNPSKDSLKNGKKVLKTTITHLKIRLDKEKIGQYLLNGNEDTYHSSNNFIEYFKGLYIKTDVLEDSKSGALYGFNVYNTRLQVYFRNGRKEGTKRDTINFSFPVTDNSVRMNQAILSRKQTQSTNKDYIYIQGLGGSNAKIEIPSLQNWADSIDYAINNAKLSFKVVPEMGNDKQKPLPGVLSLSFVNQKDEKYSLNSVNWGTGTSTINGLLNSTDSTYTFFISGLVQDIIKNKIQVKYFILDIADIGLKTQTDSYGRTTKSPYSRDKQNTVSRVVLYNKGKYRPKLDIIYTKD